MFDENTDENIVVGTILILFPNFKTKQRCSIDPNSKTIKAKNVNKIYWKKSFLKLNQICNGMIESSNRVFLFY